MSANQYLAFTLSAGIGIAFPRVGFFLLWLNIILAMVAAE